MGRTYATRKNKYSPPSNTELVEEARKPTECVHETGNSSSVVAGPVDNRVVLDIGTLQIEEGG